MCKVRRPRQLSGFGELLLTLSSQDLFQVPFLQRVGRAHRPGAQPPACRACPVPTPNGAAELGSKPGVQWARLHGQAERQREIETERDTETERQRQRETERQRQRERDRDRERERERQRQRERKRETETERQTETETKRETETERDRVRDRERERDPGWASARLPKELHSPQSWPPQQGSSHQKFAQLLLSLHGEGQTRGSTGAWGRTGSGSLRGSPWLCGCSCVWVARSCLTLRCRGL